MAAPNLLNATSIYGKNATSVGDGSNTTVLTCPADKLIKITSINVHAADSNAVSRIFIAGVQVAGGATSVPGEQGNYTLGTFYLTEAQTVVFYGNNANVDCIVSYEEIDDA